jgi:hypothetical protein
VSIKGFSILSLRHLEMIYYQLFLRIYCDVILLDFFICSVKDKNFTSDKIQQIGDNLLKSTTLLHEPYHIHSIFLERLLDLAFKDVSISFKLQFHTLN